MISADNLKAFAMVAIVLAITLIPIRRWTNESSIDTLDEYGDVHVSNDTVYFISDGPLDSKCLRPMRRLNRNYNLVIGTDF
jgi:hypothetical protein